MSDKRPRRILLWLVGAVLLLRLPRLLLPPALRGLLVLALLGACLVRYANVALAPFSEPRLGITLDSGVVDAVVVPGAPVALIATASYSSAGLSLVRYHSRLGFPFRRFHWTVTPRVTPYCEEVAGQLGEPVRPGRAKMDGRDYLIAQEPGCVEVQAKGYGRSVRTSFLVLSTAVTLEVTPTTIPTPNRAMVEFEVRVRFADGRTPPIPPPPRPGYYYSPPLEPRLVGDAISVADECDELAMGTVQTCRVAPDRWHVKARAYGADGATQPAIVTYLSCRVPITFAIRGG